MMKFAKMLNKILLGVRHRHVAYCRAVHYTRSAAGRCSRHKFVQ